MYTRNAICQPRYSAPKRDGGVDREGAQADTAVASSCTPIAIPALCGLCSRPASSEFFYSDDGLGIGCRVFNGQPFGGCSLALVDVRRHEGQG